MSTVKLYFRYTSSLSFVLCYFILVFCCRVSFGFCLLTMKSFKSDTLLIIHSVYGGTKTALKCFYNRADANDFCVLTCKLSITRTHVILLREHAKRIACSRGIIFSMFPLCCRFCLQVIHVKFDSYLC